MFCFDIVGLCVGGYIAMIAAQMCYCSNDTCFISLLLGGLIGFLIGQNIVFVYDDDEE